MRWHRDKGTGAYSAGAFTVEKATPGWHARGPGVDEPFEHLDEAKLACTRVAEARVIDKTTTPVVGDTVRVPGSWRKDSRGRVTTILNHHQAHQRVIYCVQFNVGKGRSCLFREEIELVLP